MPGGKTFSSNTTQFQGLPIIYSRSSGAPVDHVFTPVTYHVKNPDFADEVKIALPFRITRSHHVLFSFYHVSCNDKTDRSDPAKLIGNTIPDLYPRLSYPGFDILVPRIRYPRTPDLISSYPGFDTFVPRIRYPHTPDLIPSYPGFDILVPRIRYPRTPDSIPSYPGFDILVPRIRYPRTPDLIPSYPGFDILVSRI